VSFPKIPSGADSRYEAESAHHPARCPGQQSHVALFEIDQRQRVASAPRALPAKGAPNVVGTPAIVGTPVWVAAHVGVLGAADTDGVEGGVMPLSGGSKLITGAERFGFRATDGGLRPPPPTSVEPSGIPAGPTVDPGPMDEAKGGDAVADVAQVVGAVALKGHAPVEEANAMRFVAAHHAVQCSLAGAGRTMPLKLAKAKHGDPGLEQSLCSTPAEQYPRTT
jgi:hypothetical protein